MANPHLHVHIENATKQSFIVFVIEQSAKYIKVQ